MDKHHSSQTTSAPGSEAEEARRVRAWLPRTILLLGTDAAGKNHVAEVWARRMSAFGLEPILLEGWLTGPAIDPDSAHQKSWLSHLAESTFLKVFPLISWIMPWILRLLILRDAQRFHADGPRRLIVSHSALRILAFCLGARGRGIEKLPGPIRRSIREFHKHSQARVIVLDVDHDVRQERIEARIQQADEDPFDRYMLADSTRSERIEACLVSLATELMDAHLIVNNSLDDDALWAHLEEACRVGR